MKTLLKQFFIYAFIMMIFGGCSKSDSLGTGGTGNVNLAGSMARFAIAGNTLYCITNSTLEIFDITNPGAPVYLNKYTPPGNTGEIETLFARDQSTMFAGTTQGMIIFDISNKAFPSIHTVYSHITSCDPVVADSAYAYVSLSSGSNRCARGLNQLEVINISDLNHPTLLKAYPMVSPEG